LKPWDGKEGVARINNTQGGRDKRKIYPGAHDPTKKGEKDELIVLWEGKTDIVRLR